jgi:hypothetical protein
MRMPLGLASPAKVLHQINKYRHFNPGTAPPPSQHMPLLSRGFPEGVSDSQKTDSLSSCDRGQRHPIRRSEYISTFSTRIAPARSYRANRFEGDRISVDVGRHPRQYHQNVWATLAFPSRRSPMKTLAIGALVRRILLSVFLLALLGGGVGGFYLLLRDEAMKNAEREARILMAYALAVGQYTEDQGSAKSASTKSTRFGRGIG